MAGAPFWGLNEAGVSPNEGPDYATDPWDTFYVNGDQLPGFCELQNKSVAELDVEKSKGKNSSGARVRIFGYLPGGFDVVVTISTPRQWDLWQAFCDKYWPGPTKKPRPPTATVKVSHPDLARVRVGEAVIVGMPLAERSDQDGAKAFRIRFQEQAAQQPQKARVAAGAEPPQDTRLIYAAPDNATPALPSKDPKNLGLDGPPHKR